MAVHWQMNVGESGGVAAVAGVAIGLWLVSTEYTVSMEYNMVSMNRIE